MTTFADKPTLRGERVLLRPLRAGDGADLLGIMDDETKRLTGSHRDFTLSQLDDWVTTRPHTDDRLDFAVIDSESGAFVGELAVNDWDPDNHSCNIRIALGPAGVNRGLGTEAMRLAVDHVFTELPIHRISLEVYDFNPRAAHVYTKVGFQHEGRLREALWWDGRYHDAIVMSILRRDWADARG